MTQTPENNTIELKQRPKTRIARFLLPSVSADSALLPSDRWILSTAADIFKTNKPLHRDLARSALYGCLAAGSATAGLVAGVTLFATAAPLALAAVGAGLAVSFFSARGVKQALRALRTQSLPALVSDIKVRYLTLKGNEVMDAWNKRLEIRRQHKEKPAQKQAPVTPVINLHKDADKTPETKKGAASGKGATSGLGAWALKKALERAQKKPDANNADPSGDAAPKPPKPPKAG